MKYLVVVRHGEYSDGRLNNRGRAQMGTLAEKLRPLTNGATVLILASTTDRARESARILSSFFSSVGFFEEHEILWSENSHPEDLPGTLELVRSRKNEVDVLVLVTHYEYVVKFPAYFASEELGATMLSRLIGNGEAWVLDCSQKTLTHVGQ